MDPKQSWKHTRNSHMRQWENKTNKYKKDSPTVEKKSWQYTKGEPDTKKKMQRLAEGDDAMQGAF